MAIPAKKLSQADFGSKHAHLGLITTCGRSPLRARKIMVCWGTELAWAQLPQRVARWKLSFWGRNCLRNSNTAAALTIVNETTCCQSMVAR
jgi:hypothetical protein